MTKNSAIEWTNHTWNPWRGCHKVSAGCKNCYMYRDQKRYGNDPTKVVRAAKSTFYAPLKWKESALVFTCSWSDFFIEDADQWRADAWDVIKQTSHLTYQILTKRPENILDRLPDDWGNGWRNVWLGVSAEDQETANKRISLLRQVQSSIWFLSCEPLLGPIVTSLDGIDWVIAGGESGPNHRPCAPGWVRILRDKCNRAGIPFFFKQWGGTRKIGGAWGGCTLDGRTWNETPKLKVSQ